MNQTPQLAPAGVALPAEADAPRAATDWRERIIFGEKMGVEAPPAWLREAYETFREIVLHPGYPCHFGTIAERQGDLYYAFVEGGRDLSHLPATLERFARASRARPGRRNNLAVFFAPEPAPLSHEEHQAFFWETLQYLHDHDPQEERNGEHLDPDDPLWAFPFAGDRFFVVGAAPSYAARRSRNLGTGMVMLFQPRDVFDDAVSGKPLGHAARQFVRDRLLRWDGIAPHPELGVYGDPATREWKQYFLPDDARPVEGVCPFHAHGKAGPLSADDPVAR